MKKKDTQSRCDIFGFLKDINGKFSRKAIAGFSCIFTYIYLILHIIENKIILTRFQQHSMDQLLYVGGGLLGLSVFELYKLDYDKKHKKI